VGGVAGSLDVGGRLEASVREMAFSGFPLVWVLAVHGQVTVRIKYSYLDTTRMWHIAC